jgi:hypothetical protein
MSMNTVARVSLFVLGLLLAVAGIGPDHGPAAVASWWLLAAGIGLMGFSALAMIAAADEALRYGRRGY